LLAAGIGGLFLCSFFWSASAIPRAQMSPIIFSMLSHLSLIYCLFLGARASADALSEEKREGTLGLLFLTDLRGHDVVFGKLAANAMNLFYGLLAVAPLLAIPLLLGGITGSQYARTVLVLLNALWLATSAGLWVSARSENEQRAFWTVVAILFAICVCPIIPSMFSTAGYVLGGLASLGSPFVGIRLADATLYTTRASDFWFCLGIGHALGWLGLIQASRRVLSYWQTSADGPKKPGVLEWWEGLVSGNGRSGWNGGGPGSMPTPFDGSSIAGGATKLGTMRSVWFGCCLGSRLFPL
jgi:ABC-type transport system involved in multi-copper enzyme maturation permease subunit